MKRAALWIVLLISVAGIFALNYFSLPLHDELGYAFWEQAMPKTGPVARVSSFADIVKEQYLCYFAPGGNGRVFVHGIVAAFSACKAYLAFDICNTGAWCLLVWLIMRFAGISKVTLVKYLCVFLALFYLAWFAEPCCQNSAYAVNYLWPTTMGVAVLTTWKRWKSWWLVPISLLIGWSQESVALPLLAALILGLLIRSIRERRFVGNAQQVLSLMMMLVGVMMLCGGPAARGRADEYPLTLIGVFKSVIPHMVADGVLCFTPLLIFLGLVWVIWRSRRELWIALSPNLEAWLFVFCVIGLYAAIVSSGAQRVLFPGMVVGCGLLLTHRQHFQFLWRYRKLGLGFCLCWLIFAATVQCRLGCDAKEMIRTYCADEQDVTFWRPRMNFLYSATQTFLYPVQWRFLQLECGKDGEPICFSPWFYENFYLNPEGFFSQARPVMGTETVYVSSSCPVLAVKRGIDDLTEDERHCVSQFELEVPRNGWRRILPGRFGMKCPEDWCYVRLPGKGSITLTVQGQLYTVYKVVSR